MTNRFDNHPLRNFILSDHALGKACGLEKTHIWTVCGWRAKPDLEAIDREGGGARPERQFNDQAGDPDHDRHVYAHPLRRMRVVGL